MSISRSPLSAQRPEPAPRGAEGMASLARRLLHPVGIVHQDMGPTGPVQRSVQRAFPPCKRPIARGSAAPGAAPPRPPGLQFQHLGADPGDPLIGPDGPATRRRILQAAGQGCATADFAETRNEDIATGVVPASINHRFGNRAGPGKGDQPLRPVRHDGGASGRSSSRAAKSWCPARVSRPCSGKLQRFARRRGAPQHPVRRRDRQPISRPSPPASAGSAPGSGTGESRTTSPPPSE